MRLVVAWLLSSFAGALVAYAGSWVTALLMGAPSPSFSAQVVAVTRGLTVFFLFCLALQLIYGGLLYLILGYLGILNFPVVVVAYAVPMAVLIWWGSDMPKDILMGMPRVIGAITLGVVGWMLAKA